MGLDMYLIGRVYVKDWKHDYDNSQIPEDTPAKVSQKAIGSKFPVSEIELDLGYWRKANHIHKWFVDNVQGGEDECQKSYVSNDQLKQLHSICCEILADHSKTELLPTKGGFFFGSTDYDEYYFKDIQDTKEILEKLFESGELDKMSVYYQASW